MSPKQPDISKGIDWVLFWLYIILVSIGITSIFAATYRNEDIVQGFFSFKTDYGKQALFFVFSIIIGTVILLTDSKFFTATANLSYAFGILLLLLVFRVSVTAGGTV